MSGPHDFNVLHRYHTNLVADQRENMFENRVAKGLVKDANDMHHLPCVTEHAFVIPRALRAAPGQCWQNGVTSDFIRIENFAEPRQNRALANHIELFFREGLQVFLPQIISA